MPPDFPSRLTELSERDRIWETHKANNDHLAEQYFGSQFSGYHQRLTRCSDILAFEITTDQFKLANARFCRVRHCPICQWRRSLKWKARAYKTIPTVIQDFPKYRWLFLTLTVKNCPIDNLRDNLTWMHASFKRLTKLKAWCVKGWIKSTEITRGQDGLAHPHFHCLLMVPPSYFSGSRYLSREKWAQLWQQSLRIDYLPIIDIRAIPPTENPTVLIPEILKYQTKVDDLMTDREWLLQLTQQLHKSRAIAVGGVLSQYMRDLKREPESLLDEIAETDHQKAKALIYFNWVQPAKLYKLDY